MEIYPRIFAPPALIFRASSKNLSDRNGEGLAFGHGREIGFETELAHLSLETDFSALRLSRATA